MKNTVEQWTGVKVSVGVAPSKVLAKAANHLILDPLDLKVYNTTLRNLI